MKPISLSIHDKKADLPAKPKAVREKKASVWNREIQLGKRFGLAEKQLFFQLMGDLLESGLNLRDALKVLMEQEKKAQIQSLIQDLIEQIETGVDLSAALSQHAKFFDAFELASIRAGEQGAKLVPVLRQLEHYYGERVKIRKKLIQVMTYPLVVIGIAVLVVGFMITQVVPMFEEVFRQFGAELPIITQKLLSVSAFVRSHSLLGLMGLGGIFLLFRYLNRQYRFRRLRDQLLLHIPVIGPMVLSVHLARFCVSMGTLLQAKLKLDQALALCAEIIQFVPLKSRIPLIREQIQAGAAFYLQFPEGRLFPPLFRQLIQVGEKTAQLEQMFDRLGTRYQLESESRIQRFSSLLEPLLVLILGLLVGGILIAMYLPMFQLGQNINV